MKQTIRFSVVAMLLCNVAFAQSVDDGKKFFYYEKYQSAKETLEKALAAKPGDVDAAYWLGQTLIEQNDVNGAKSVYQTALQSKGSDPLLLVGMGHVELLENKTNEARQRFEVAISSTKNKNIDVLNAIGRANADAAAGDANYAIEKLKTATEVKKFKEPSVFINMGDAYRKLADGGGAVTSYNQALAIQPSYAESKYKVGKIYLTQGNDQADIFVKNFEEAIALDPAYAPAYYELYKYWYARDVNKARDYFSKYKANTDFTPSVEAEEISLVYASGDFSGAIAKADEKIKAEGDKADAKLFRVKAYAYDKLGDSVNALQNMETFFAKAHPDDIMPDNFVKMADISSKFPDKIDQAESYIHKLFDVDTITSNRVAYAKSASDMYKKTKNYAKSAEWLTKVLALKPDTYTKTELFYAGWENFYGDNYQTSDSIASIYKGKYPDETQGWYLAFRSKWALVDTADASTQALPVEDAKKFIEVAEVDKEKNKQALTLAYRYMAGYTNNELKDAETALIYLNKVLELNPQDEDVKKHIEVLEQVLKSPRPRSASR